MLSPRQQQLQARQAEILSAVGHPTRIAIVQFLADGEQCVCDIATQVGAERSNVSRHLSVLLKAGVVSQRKSGLKMMYTLEARCVLNFLDCLTKVLIRQHQQDAEFLQAIAGEE
jgi:ArsR family transcriptional regulator